MVYIDINQIISAAPPYIIGAIGGIGTMFATGFTKEFFDERNRVSKNKMDVARQVLKICNEASTNGFRKTPRDMEHVNSVLTDLEGINKGMSVEMEKFSTSWQLIPRERSKGNLSPDDVRFVKSHLDRVERKRKILVTWANKIRAGNQLRDIFIVKLVSATVEKLKKLI